MGADLLREHQQVLFSMLEVVDEICKKHQIKYMLFAGTALGAVRHKGFIPWDDDLDIIMMRSDYEKFLNVAEAELDEKYFLQKEFSEHWPCFFSKLRKNNTACIEKTIPKDQKQHQGVYIDIFPCDNLSDNKVIRCFQFMASKVVIAKSLFKRGYLTNSKKKKLFIKICALLPRKPFQVLVENRNAVNSAMVHSFFGASSKYSKSIYQRRWITDVLEIEFEKNFFPISFYYNELLTTQYGDYMIMPPKEERVLKKHAIKVDLNESFEKYLDWQKEQKINVYTRSIR